MKIFARNPMKIFARNTLCQLMVFGRVIDIGCFDGHMFRDQAINVDHKRYGMKVPNHVLADAHYLPFKDNSFDCAVMSEILEHVTDPKKCIEEARRVAKLVILTVPNEWEWQKQLNPFTNPGHIHNFNETSFLRLVYDSGLRILEFIKINTANGWSHFFVRGISKGE